MLALLLASVNTSHAQKWAVKSNLLYDATATINLGVEAALGRRVTLDVSGNYNPWKFGDARWKHWLVQPEVRYWLCESFNGHFFGRAFILKRVCKYRIFLTKYKEMQSKFHFSIAPHSPWR